MPISVITSALIALQKKASVVAEDARLDQHAPAVCWNFFIPLLD